MLDIGEQRSMVVAPVKAGKCTWDQLGWSQEEADWQRTSSGTNPSGGVCTNLTDWNPFLLLLPACTYECTQLTNFCSKRWQLHNVDSQYHLWDTEIIYGTVVPYSDSLFFLALFQITHCWLELLWAILLPLYSFLNQQRNLWVAAEAALNNQQHDKSGCGQCNMS